MKNGIVFVEAARIAAGTSKNVLLKDLLDDIRVRVHPSNRPVDGAAAPIPNWGLASEPSCRTERERIQRERCDQRPADQQSRQPSTFLRFVAYAVILNLAEEP
jgi:hypothetical protein